MQRVQAMVDDSARSADLRRWQQAADRHVASTPSGEVASGRAPVQRMRMSQSNSFYGKPRDSSEFPLFYRASILRHLAQQNIAVAEDTPQVLCVPIVYGQTVEIRWFEVTAEDVRDMQRAVNALTPEAREAARLDANARGDDTGDVNPSAFQDNCGYCVLTRLLGKDDADQLVKEMEEADLSDGMANHWLSLDSIADTLRRYGRFVGFPATNMNRDQLREWILGISQGSDQVAFVVHFPSHFIIAYPQSDGSILIEDPQTTDFFDFDALPDTAFKTFAVDRP